MENNIKQTIPEKPLLVARDEFIEKLVDLINNSGLPMVVVEPILNNVCSTVHATVQQQFEREKAAYTKEMAEAADKEE